MLPPVIQTFYTCNAWANARVLAALQVRREAVEAETQTFVAALNADLLGPHLHLSAVADDDRQVNSTTQHRSETAILLTHWGFSPGELDFITYIDKRDAGA